MKKRLIYPIIISGEKAQKEFLRILKEEKEEVLKQYKNFIHTIIRIDDKMYINYLLLYYKYIIKKKNFKR